jgi:hypothetical protein
MVLPCLSVFEITERISDKFATTGVYGIWSDKFKYISHYNL